ncbi:Cytochrome P450 [Glarea lozoyensis ATCC 20868]|uniref:Cytochrome P450 n=1 Tax=Glarea lozoyensis (strain ATCC 20868 / MF5171) TaxID=1116229 RepID=S3CLL7_GLAL2|nr:Cytochrome P450 [Glarea lozoyensis ATCC 20868]EPE26099.1 Cytochrome P450 [Glarea lozoyensis ATCC 20868]
MLSPLFDFQRPVILVGVLGTIVLAAKYAKWRSQTKDELKSMGDLFSLFEALISTFRKRVKAWRFLIQGPTLIADAYKKANGAPFSLDVPENRYHFVSTWEHIEEINAVPDTVLSLTAAAKEILQPQYTMHNFDWANSRGRDSVPLNRTLRTYLTNYLPNLMPEVRRHLRAIFDRHILSGPLKNGFFSPKLFPMLVECIAHSNIMSFFGEELVQNPEFMKAGVGFIETTLIISEVVRVLPQAISPTVGRFLSRTFNSQNVIFDTLMPLVELRLEERERKKQGYEVPEHNDCIQWIINGTTRPWAAERVVHELIALWFGSVHITSTTACFVLHDLCLHPEYIPILRKDIERSGWGSFDQSKGQEFPLLDSFMKESSRLNPVEAMSTRRIALKPFELSGGHKVPVGEWVCTAPKAMHRDQVYWAKPLDFHGFRFVEPKLYDTILSATQFEVPEPGKQSAFNEVLDWQLWGTGRNACSGRFYATALVKTMLALLIMNYDMKLADPRRSKNSFVWRSFIYPYASTPILLKPRSVTF